MLDKAITLTSLKFEGKKDKGGVYYILHCLHVMFMMDIDDEELMTIAVLHDLVEDTDVTVNSLLGMGFSARVVDGVRYMTHLDGEDYNTYIKRVSMNPDARLVKMADLQHNSDIMRMKGLRKKDFERLEKYHIAMAYLKD